MMLPVRSPHVLVLACVLALVVAAGGAVAGTTPTTTEQQRAEPEVPFVPTPEKVVDEMLRVAKVGKNDVLYDLGSGDGRIVITAARRFGTRGVGIDIDPQRVKEANENAQRAGVTHLVKFIEGDIFEADIREATVVTLYLLPAVNLRLKPKLLEDLRPGTRVVSHNYDMGDWKPLQTLNVTTPTGGNHTVYYWTVPARAAGSKKR